MALPERNDRADEATVSFAAEPAASTPEAVAADEPRAKLPEALTAAAEHRSSDESVTAPLPGSAAETSNGQVDPGPSNRPGGEPRDTRTLADATVPIPAGRDADEPTDALPVPPSPNGLKASVPQPAASDLEPAPADATVAIPPVADSLQGDGTVTSPAPVPGAPRRPGHLVVGRRRLLLAGAGVIAAAVVGGIVVEADGGEPDVAGSHVQASKRTPVATTKPREPATTHVTPAPVAVQRAPIFTLSEYRKATGAGPFPADAIALTIDDGPHPVWTPKIMRLLDRYHVPAMFCMIGNQVLGHEGIAKMVTRAGHQLANHTWSHPTTLEKKTGDAVRREIGRAQEKIHDTTGYTPRFFRSPGGAWSPMVLQQAAAAGLLPLDWTNDPKDWSRPGINRIEHTMLAAHPGQILLCHDGGGDRSQTYNALKVVLPQLKARGLQFVAL